MLFSVGYAVVTLLFLSSQLPKDYRLKTRGSSSDYQVLSYG